MNTSVNLNMSSGLNESSEIENLQRVLNLYLILAKQRNRKLYTGNEGIFMIKKRTEK